MNIIKRNGNEVAFEADKIGEAISKANKSIKDIDRISDETIKDIQKKIEDICLKSRHTVSVEEVQDMVEKELYNVHAYSLMKSYMLYRYDRSLARKKNTIDDSILTLLNDSNEEIKQENSNKNPTIISVQRDYMAGEVSKDIVRRYLFPKDLMESHDSGELHIHDMDYIGQKSHNCDLLALDDMLQNGTVISGTKIDKPNSFSTACNVATQIIAQVASSQYGGCSFSLSHLIPFIDVSRNKIRKQVIEESKEFDIEINEEKINKIVEKRLFNEIKNGIQTIQYQLVTLQTTNGQAPFVTMFMYINEVPEGQAKKDLVTAIEEVLKQRILGVKNEKGEYITVAFPKLIYVLEEDNIKPGTKYWYLTELAAKCTAKRLVPDYVSEKKMLEYKVDKNGEGHCYTPMGCRSFLTPYIDPETGKPKYYGRLTKMLSRLKIV